jgi:xanthine dehydrogenase YagT iron-sulfur-binding subunit
MRNSCAAGRQRQNAPATVFCVQIHADDWSRGRVEFVFGRPLFTLEWEDESACVSGVQVAAKLWRQREGEPMTAQITLQINGTAHTLQIEPRVSLLDALREYLGLTGAKKGCNQGACGACTVLVDGERTLSCLGLAIQYEGTEIQTIEGLDGDGVLHPMQAAFVEHDGFQCGYCTPGQICSAAGLIAEAKAKTTDEIRELMSGNICRCGAYPGIVQAIQNAYRQSSGN